MHEHRNMQRRFECLWILDQSGSMGADARLQKALQYTREALSMLPSALEYESPGVDVRFGCVAGGEPRWIVERGTPVADVVLPSLTASGYSPVGQMLTMVADSEMRLASTPKSAGVSLIVLFTDGYVTDNWEMGIARLRCVSSFHEQHRLAVPLSTDIREDVIASYVSENSPDPASLSDPLCLVHHAAALMRAACGSDQCSCLS
jgi:uncharacterized protein YegL